MSQQGYIVVSREYEGHLHAGREAQLQALKLSHDNLVASLREHHAEDVAKRDLQLAVAKEQGSKLKQEILAWRKKAVLYKMKLASAEESAQLTQASLSTSERIVADLTEDREALLQCNRVLQEQGELAATSADAKELHSQLLESQELADLLSQQLADERASLESVRSQAEALRAQLAAEQSDKQAQAAAAAALRVECSQLRASLKEEQEARAHAEARASKLGSDLQVQRAELEAAEQRLTRHMQGSAERDEQLTQQYKAAEDAVKQELSQRDADDELQRLEAKLKREATQREAAEAECAQQSTVNVQLRRQATARAAQLSELEAVLERNTQRLSQQVTNKDALVTALQEQLEQERRKLGHKEAELREMQATHAHQFEQLQRRLTAHEAASREQEAALRQQLEVARLQAAQSGSTEAQTQTRLVELQTALSTREDRVRQLQEGLAAEVSRCNERIRELQKRHTAELVEWESKTRQLQQQIGHLEHQLAVARSAAATVDKLMGNLFGSGAGGGMGTVDEEDDDRGPSADLILSM
ncbi:hypothetical protein GPECTOR_74g710 [Gonium pectorale]|uniref:Uncharacterized protein n=1 Tax=Gonium pectorale TaxID=33097 RepID=A0A150G2J5_GONPE|nr:hypothetical protein GPECTOR_74g710 [Gonium pectorale]|eukprot:KXZ44096.1 hypothetical protein GPECTOR_74g710 [Gonium pectorale]